MYVNHFNIDFYLMCINDDSNVKTEVTVAKVEMKFGTGVNQDRVISLLSQDPDQPRCFPKS